MAQCLGGTREQPRHWVRFTADGDVEQRGRVDGCKVDGRPDLDRCHGCPAFRGTDRDGIVRGITALNGDLVAMTRAEHEAWEEDPEAFWARVADGSPWVLRHSGTLEWDEHWAAYQREYHARMSAEQRERRRETNREAARRYRQRAKDRHLNSIPPANSRARDLVAEGGL